MDCIEPVFGQIFLGKFQPDYISLQPYEFFLGPHFLFWTQNVNGLSQEIDSVNLAQIFRIRLNQPQL